MAEAKQIVRQKDWMARSTLNFYQRNKGVMMIPQTVLLASNTVLKVMANTFEVVTRDAHYITIASRIILSDRVSGKIYQEDEVFKAESAINDHLGKINEYFDRRIQQAEQKISLAGQDPNAVPYAATGYEALRTTQVGTDYLGVLMKADRYLVLHEYLWIIGELSDTPSEALKAKLNNEREVRNHLLSIPRKTTSHFNIIRRICNGVMDERKTARAAQSARDKARAAEEKKKNAVAEDSLDDDDGLGMMPLPGSDVALSAVAAA